MNTITTTQLRTRSSELIEEMKRNNPVTLIHRSQIVATIQPAEEKTKILDARAIKKLKKAIEALNLPKTTYAEREKRYRAHLTKKYGQSLSRH